MLIPYINVVEGLMGKLKTWDYFFIKDFKNSNCFIWAGESSARNNCERSSFSWLVNEMFSCFNCIFQLVITGSASFIFFPLSKLNNSSTFCRFILSMPRKAGLFLQFSNLVSFLHWIVHYTTNFPLFPEAVQKLIFVQAEAAT